MIASMLKAENGDTLRGLTGQGEPGKWTLLGGTAAEQDADSLALGGGPGQISSASRLAQSRNEARIAGVASGSIGYKPPIPTGPPGRRPGIPYIP